MSFPVEPKLEVVHEDNHTLVVVKPARLLVAPDETGDANLLDLAREYLKQKYQKPGNVFVGLVHRLDRPVSGLVLFARTSKAAARLSDQFRVRSISKKYLALVEGLPKTPRGDCHSWLSKDRETNLVRPVAAGSEGAREARLSWKVVERFQKTALIEVELETGRSHQIRVQLSEMGHPICGDAKYGSRVRGEGRIALHASELTFEHPTLHSSIVLNSAPPRWWNRLRG